MRIRFETTIEDLIAFNRFHVENSPSLRRQRLIFSLMIPAILAFVGIFTVLLNLEAIIDDPVPYLILATVFGMVGLPFAIGAYFLSRWNWTSNLERNVRKIYEEGNNRAVLGWREMELVNNRLILKMALIESSMDLRAIDKIVGDDKFTYVYISSNQAYMIPMDLYPEEEYHQFVSDLREAWERRDESRHEKPPPTKRDERIAEGPG